MRKRRTEQECSDIIWDIEKTKKRSYRGLYYEGVELELTDETTFGDIKSYLSGLKDVGAKNAYIKVFEDGSGCLIDGDEEYMFVGGNECMTIITEDPLSEEAYRAIFDRMEQELLEKEE